MLCATSLGIQHLLAVHVPGTHFNPLAFIPAVSGHGKHGRSCSFRPQPAVEPCDSLQYICGPVKSGVTAITSRCVWRVWECLQIGYNYLARYLGSVEVFTNPIARKNANTRKREQKINSNAKGLSQNTIKYKVIVVQGYL